MADVRTRRPRSRGSKTPLTVDAVVDAALACLREGGAERLTMRNVATRLETGPGSLYAYVRDQRELYVLVLDAIAARVPEPSPEGPWRQRLITLLVDYAEELSEYPGAASLAMTAPPTGPRSLDLTETALGLLLEGGLGVDKAAIACDPLFLLVIATIAEQDAQRQRRPQESIATSYRSAIESDPQRHPHLAAAREALFSGEGADRLAWTLDALLTGVLES